MAIRNPWVLPAVILILLAALGLAVFGSAAIKNEAQPAPPSPAAHVLQVPGSYSTIQAAIDAAHPGDTIQIAAGTYHENVMVNKPVSLIAGSFDPANAANNGTVLDGGTGEATIFITADLQPMPTIQGFAIRNSRDGIETHARFIAENNYFYGSQISVEYQPGGGGINRNNVYFNSSNDALHVDDLAAPLLIQNNRFLYAGDDAVEINLQADTNTASAEADVWDNILIGSSQDGIKVVDDATTPKNTNRRIVIAGNLIANNRRAGIGFMRSSNTNEDYSGADSTEAVRVYNNTFYGNDYGISGGGNAVLFNNIIANSTSLGAWRVQSPPGGNSVVAYTLFFNNRVDMDQTMIGAGNIIDQDPLFVAGPEPGPDGAWGTADDDFRGLLLRPGSPAVDKGITQYRTASGELVPPTPLTGYVGAAPDLGWRELGSSLFMTATPAITAAPQTAASVTIAATGTATSIASATPAATGTGKPGITQTPGFPAPTGTPGATATPEATSTPLPTGTLGLVIQSVAPPSVQANSTVTLTLKGSGFEDGASVSFEGVSETPPQVTSVQVVNATTMIVGVTTTDDSVANDVWTLRVTNPDGTTALLLDALTVTP